MLVKIDKLKASYSFAHLPILSSISASYSLTTSFGGMSSSYFGVLYTDCKDSSDSLNLLIVPNSDRVGSSEGCLTISLLEFIEVGRSLFHRLFAGVF